jgi:hypothetical protein
MTNHLTSSCRTGQKIVKISVLVNKNDGSNRKEKNSNEFVRCLHVQVIFKEYIIFAVCFSLDVV